MLLSVQYRDVHGEKESVMAKDETWLPLPVRLSQEVDRLFDELIHRPWGFSRATIETWNPQIDLYETEAAFILEADLPGVQEQDVSVEIDKGDLVLQGRRSFTRTATQGNFYHSERRSGNFVRRLRLPASVNQSQIRAEFGQGVLRVTLPKLREREA
jgi:HSP20 family protein